MKVIILGAGASFDSLITIHEGKEQSLHWKPPLVAGLFSERKNFREIIANYPGADAIAADAQVAPDIGNFFQDIMILMK
jgi:hypothetical protein